MFYLVAVRSARDCVAFGCGSGCGSRDLMLKREFMLGFGSAFSLFYAITAVNLIMMLECFFYERDQLKSLCCICYVLVYI